MINSASRPRHSTEGILRPFTQAILVRHLLHVFRRLAAMMYPELQGDSRKKHLEPSPSKKWWDEIEV